jgi:hypothetical protein
VSHHELQRALVISLYDATFPAALASDPGLVAGLTAAERGQLLQVDPRALRTDPLRRRRTLRTLAEEFKASTTLALAETRSLAFAEGFFASPQFRDAVLARRPLAPALGEFLLAAVDAGRLRTALLRDIVRLELTAARCRRARELPPRPGIALAPGVAVAALDAAALPAVQLVERWLFELGLMPQAALCDDAPPVPALPAAAGGTTRFLWTPATSGVSLTTIDEGLYRVLATLEPPATRAQAAAALVATGVPAARADELVQTLLEEGLLAEGPPPGAELLAHAREGGHT